MKMTLPGSLIKPFIKLHLQSANMYELTTGEYTVVFELAFPLRLLPIHIDISATSSIETISRVSTPKSADCTRSLVYLHKYNSVTP